MRAGSTRLVCLTDLSLLRAEAAKGPERVQKVQRWLKRHPRFHVHFTPTSASWLNRVERFFRDLTENGRGEACSGASSN